MNPGKSKWGVYLSSTIWGYVNREIAAIETNRVGKQKYSKGISADNVKLQNQLAYIKKVTNLTEAWKKLEKVHESKKGLVRKAVLYK